MLDVVRSEGDQPAVRWKGSKLVQTTHKVWARFRGSNGTIASLDDLAETIAKDPDTFIRLVVELRQWQSKNKAAS